MTPEDFRLLGARLLLVRRCYMLPSDVAALPDQVVLAMAGLLEGGAR